MEQLVIEGRDLVTHHHLVVLRDQFLFKHDTVNFVVDLVGMLLNDLVVYFSSELVLVIILEAKLFGWLLAKATQDVLS